VIIVEIARIVENVPIVRNVPDVMTVKAVVIVFLAGTVETVIIVMILSAKRVG